MDDLAKQQVATQVVIQQRDAANNRIVDLTVELAFAQERVKQLELNVQELQTAKEREPEPHDVGDAPS